MKEKVDQLIAAYDGYLKVLDGELSDLYGLAMSHGWKSTRVAAGHTAREAIARSKAELSVLFEKVSNKSDRKG